MQQVLPVTHDGWLVLAALALALMAGFTGLSLTRGASALPPPRRKAVVSMAAVALGGGIWSMHFVAMLGLQLGVLFYYDALITLISALAAILITGIALLLLHFRPRTPGLITLAGAVIGLGIPVMHYIGMSGIELCRAVYAPAEVALAVTASVLLGIAVVWIAYGRREVRNILWGTLVFGAAVVAVHFLAMAGTDFVAAADPAATGPLIGNQSLAILVTLAAFVISGAFLLTGVTFAAVPEVPAPAPVLPAVPPAPEPVAPRAVMVPYEREGRTFFVDAAGVDALRAEGHYTVVHFGAEQTFCPWAISEAETRLAPAGFLRVHRSYLINPARVTGFERVKDTGLCFFAASPGLGRVPVSRSRLGAVKGALGL